MERLTRSSYPLLQRLELQLGGRNGITSTPSGWPKRLNKAGATRQFTQSRRLNLENDNDRLLPEYLNPSPSSYSITPFTDRCTLDLFAGNGGCGCVSFVREKYIPEGPPNGGNGGSGGSIYIQAVRGETSLHKLARTKEIRAGNGKNGQGKNKGGERGKDVLLTVPVGTVVREVWRHDPIEEREYPAKKGELQRDISEPKDFDDARKNKLVMYPGAMRRSDLSFGETLTLPRNRKPPLAALQSLSPITLDLDYPMEIPILLAAGAAGGLGNPNFVTKDFLRPKFATKGEIGLQVTLSLELKILADVGLVGQPNAGKSTLLRSLSNSRTRIGNWAFTTLQPNIGTVILDDHKGRPSIKSFQKGGQVRTSFTIADIPGVIEDAHMDKGLGLGFLRHIERASILAFVIDLSAGNAIESLKALWSEIGQYEISRSEIPYIEKAPTLSQHYSKLGQRQHTSPVTNRPISSKPWFVVATKADLPNTENNFSDLVAYIADLKNNKVAHPSGQTCGWTHDVVAIPVSAINLERVHEIPKIVVDLL